MTANIKFRDGYEMPVEKVKCITYYNLSSDSICKIENIDNFFLDSYQYNFNCENGNFVINGADVLFINFFS